MIIGRENKSTPRKNLSTINPEWTDLGLNPGLRVEQTVTDLLSYGTA
jgi:hypothetical protein